MIVFVDANVLLDVLLNRAELEIESREVWSAAETRQVTGFVSSLSVATIYYLAYREKRDRGFALQCVAHILDVFQVASVDQQIIQEAARSGQRDFKDAIQSFTAHSVSASCVITRDIRDFIGGPVRPIAPREFIDIQRALRKP